ncbi:hypothetical protein [Bacillus sp. JJ722]|uniref:hypothetical protein n=1 Tax=Bacillus sp. JJ722 TaxID=3122973 RepID=UPI002FFF4E1E
MEKEKLIELKIQFLNTLLVNVDSLDFDKRDIYTNALIESICIDFSMVKNESELNINPIDTKFNINNYVKVKLTKEGISELKRQHDELNEYIKCRGGKGSGEFQVTVDNEGYTKMQLWKLMEGLGHLMGICNKTPFENEIVFCK